METYNSQVSDKEKNAAAIRVMRSMLTNYATEKNEPFENVLLQFSKSNTYELLFDFGTNVWREGPLYLRSLYDDELANRVKQSSQL